MVLALPLPLFAAARPAPGAATPQALVARLKAAAAANDFGEIVDCIAPAQRHELTAGLVLGTTMMVAFLDMGADMASGMAQGMTEAMGADGKPTAEQQAAADKAKAEAKAKTDELKARHQAIMDRYGLSKRMEEMQHGEAGNAGASPEESIGKLLEGIDERSLVVDLLGFMEDIGKSQGKDHANDPMDLPKDVTDIKIDGDHATGKSGEETVRFVRVDGRWYLEPENKPSSGG
jgi:hypothetical protein